MTMCVGAEATQVWRGEAARAWGLSHLLLHDFLVLAVLVIGWDRVLDGGVLILRVACADTAPQLEITERTGIR